MSSDEAKPISISAPLSAEQVASFRARLHLRDDANSNGTDSGGGVSANGRPSVVGSARDRRDSLTSAASFSSPRSPTLAMPRTDHYSPKGNIPNTPLAAAMINAGLGAIAGAALFAAALPLWRATGLAEAQWARPQLGIYLASVAIFHLLEFWTTAGWNYDKLSVDAFLLNNGRQYHAAHLFGLTEYFIASYLWPNKFESVYASPKVMALFLCMMIGGQAFRSLAMVHAGRSFSHLVKYEKLEDHTLVTTGVYAWVRHPSYVGFFYWAVATQLLLCNVVSPIGFVIVLSRFFGARIADEEIHLVRFFGDAYIAYRKKVASGLPFLKV